jgi:hypothetical protein
VDGFYQECQDEATNEYRCSADYKLLERKYIKKTCPDGRRACESSGEYWKTVKNCATNQLVCNPAIWDCNSPTLTVWCFSAPNPVKANKPTWFIAQASGGIGPYRYDWSGDAVGNSQSSKVTFTGLGNYTAKLLITAHTQAKEATCQVNVTSAGCFCSRWSKEWQNVGCGQGSCGKGQMMQKRTRNCYPTACGQEAETRCQADSSCQDNDNPTSGTLSVNQTSKNCDQYGRNCSTKIGITVSGYDQDGLSEFRAYYQYDWHSQSVSGTSQTRSWEFTENRPGKFNYPFCGNVIGLRPDGVKGAGVYTTPSCIFLEINNN